MVVMSCGWGKLQGETVSSSTIKDLLYGMTKAGVRESRKSQLLSVVSTKYLPPLSVGSACTKAASEHYHYIISKRLLITRPINHPKQSVRIASRVLNTCVVTVYQCVFERPYAGEKSYLAWKYSLSNHDCAIMPKQHTPKL